MGPSFYLLGSGKREKEKEQIYCKCDGRSETKQFGAGREGGKGFRTLDLSTRR